MNVTSLGTIPFVPLQVVRMGDELLKSLGNRANDLRVGKACVSLGIPTSPDVRHAQLLDTVQRSPRT